MFLIGTVVMPVNFNISIICLFSELSCSVILFCIRLWSICPYILCGRCRQFDILNASYFFVMRDLCKSYPIRMAFDCCLDYQKVGWMKIKCTKFDSSDMLISTNLHMIVYRGIYYTLGFIKMFIIIQWLYKYAIHCFLQNDLVRNKTCRSRTDFVLWPE